MSAPIATVKDRQEFLFKSVEAKEPNAVQRLYGRGWPLRHIAKMLKCDIEAARRDLNAE